MFCIHNWLTTQFVVFFTMIFFPLVIAEEDIESVEEGVFDVHL